jgi:predicted flavoprotein YhiN
MAASWLKPFVKRRKNLGQACYLPFGLYFIGEVVDVTGQLGGYNFQWAWASAFAAGQAV